LGDAIDASSWFYFHWVASFLWIGVCEDEFLFGQYLRLMFYVHGWIFM
jgi:hypothetical protein